MLSLLKDGSITLIVVEHQDRLTRFGFRYIETLLSLQGCAIEVVNQAEDGKEDLLQDVGKHYILDVRQALRATPRQTHNRNRRQPVEGCGGRRAMRLVEQHIIEKGDPRLALLDAAAFASKNLWNAANYLVRQSFIFEHVYLDNVKVFHLIKSHDSYKALPAKVSNQVLIQLHKAWKAFFEATAEYGEHPEKFVGRPKLPRYKHKEQGRNLQSKLARQDRFTCRQLEQLTDKRNRRIKHYLHVASHRLVGVLVEAGISTLVIGKNPLWKQEVEMGKRHNQSFVQIPHARFIEMVQYKAALVGIQVKITEEAYTSKASFLDLDPIPSYDPNRTELPKFSGRRVSRGMYQTSSKRLINADVNGSFNIGRKVFPTAFGLGIAASAVRPRRLAV